MRLNNLTHIHARAALLFLLTLLAPSAARARQATPTPSPAPPPNTDVFVVDLKGGGGALRLGQPAAVTTWDGYDNQPSFTPDGRALLYTSIRADSQADIYRYDLRGRSTARLTETRESEFSPTVTPDGRFFSVVRVEADGTQRLWKFPLAAAAGGAPALVLEKVKPVGYHAWIDERRLALFVLGEPNTLQLAEVGAERAEVVERNIGRALHRVPRGGGEFSFVHKVSGGEWYVKGFDPKTRAARILVKTLTGSEDLAWTPGGVMLMAKDSKLFAFDPARDKEWREVADFAASGLRSITRLAVSPKGDRLALVAQRAAGR